jgi:hypothetical protein
MQCSCKTKLRVDGQVEEHVISGEESEAVTNEEDGSEGEFVTERKEPVQQCRSGRSWQRTRPCGRSFASNWGWKLVLWVSIGWWY